MSADASDDIGHKKMAFLASALCQEITSTIFDLLPSMPRTDDDGNPKYTGFMLMQHEPEGGYKDWQYGQLLDPSATRDILFRKHTASTIAAGKTSIEVRDTGDDVPKPKKIWGGWVFSYGISGLPEVADHVWTTTLQFFAGLITEDQYRKRLEPAWPGVQASLEQFSVLDDIYHTFVQRAREMAWNVTQSDGWKEQFPKAA